MIFYICGKVQDDYVIIFGQNKSNINRKGGVEYNYRSFEKDLHNKYDYYLIDNLMKPNISNNVINIVCGSFNGNQYTKERTENIKKKLDENFTYISWNVFIYQNGYCKVSFSDDLYICGKILDDYIIIFGENKKFNKFKNRNRKRSRSKSFSLENRNRSRCRSRSRSGSKDSKEN